MLANWVHRDGERLAGPGRRLAAAARRRRARGAARAAGPGGVRRDLAAPTRVSAATRRTLERYDAWLAALEREHVAAVGPGLRRGLRRTGADRRVTTLDWPHPVEQPLGPHLADLARPPALAGGPRHGRHGARSSDRAAGAGRRAGAARPVPAPRTRSTSCCASRPGCGVPSPADTAHRRARRCVRRDARPWAHWSTPCARCSATTPARGTVAELLAQVRLSWSRRVC